MTTYKHWKLDTDNDNILWLSFDRQGESVNTINVEVLDELGAICDHIAQEKPKGVVIQSAKKKGFVAGADISQFIHFTKGEEAFDLMRHGQKTYDKLAALPVPTVALINGFSMGGGTELALACRYRIACDTPDTKIGLPEIKLGIYPGWGGSVRLPRLVGSIQAMTMILSGSALSARAAKKIGLVDEAVADRELKRAAIYYIKNSPKPRQPKGLAAWSNLPFLRPLLAKMFYSQLAKKKVNKTHYPAPFAVVKAWQRDGASGDEKSFVNEAKAVADLSETSTAHNLIRIFFLQSKMKALGKGVKFKAQHVHVIGAGTMGGDIAAWCALRGCHVTLQDQAPERIAPAIKRAYTLYKKKLKKPRLIEEAMDRLQPDVEGLGVSRADVVIEAIFENLEVKQKLFKALEPKLKPNAIMATNTSSIPLEEIATALQSPERLVGIHFFNPVAKMPLVEVVKSKQTKDEIVTSAAAFVNQIGRFPVVVASSPGFLVNRALMPYMMEAMALYEEGVSKEAIDKAAVKFGMPMGPITLADMVGLDIVYHVGEELSKHFGGALPAKLKDMVDAKKLGVKSGEGFYKYNNGKKVGNGDASGGKSSPDIADRLILRMVNEAVACLDEGVIDNDELLDAGMIFGTGFAPFHGGPIKYAKDRGVKEVVATLEKFEKQYGERFKPHAGWSKITNE